MSTSVNSCSFLYNRVPYIPPLWVQTSIDQDRIPKSKINLFSGPTPLHPFKIPGLEETGLVSIIKRDDLTSFDMSGT